MATQIQVRRDSAADWTSNDPTGAAGEIGWESDTNRFKIFDGSTAWTSLAYADQGAVVVVGPLLVDAAVTTTGTQYTFRMPFAMTLTDVRASVDTAASTGTVTVDINDGGTTVLSTKLTIDATEKTSTTAAAAAVISDSALADDAEITVDVDDKADDNATNLNVTLVGLRA